MHHHFSCQLCFTHVLPMFYHIYSAVGDRLGIPRVQIFVSPNSPFDHMIPTPLSYIPLMVLPGFTDKMTFLQRVTNVVVYIGLSFCKDLILARPMNALKLKHTAAMDKENHRYFD